MSDRGTESGAGIMPDHGSADEGVIQVRIRYLGAVRDLTGHREDAATFTTGATLGDVAAWLRDRYDLIVPSAQVMAVLMGRGWEQLEQGLATKLRDGDAVALFPPVAGG
jgi:MoaD family protein